MKENLIINSNMKSIVGKQKINFYIICLSNFPSPNLIQLDSAKIIIYKPTGDHKSLSVDVLKRNRSTDSINFTINLLHISTVYLLMATHEAFLIKTV